MMDTSADHTNVHAAECCRGLLTFLDKKPNREGLSETPVRMAKALRFLTAGKDEDPLDVLKTFEDGATNYDEMVMQKGIPFFSLCEHHVLPFFGVAHVAYVPHGKIVGLSKIARVVDIISRRLQVQERMTVEIRDTLQKGLNPKGVIVVVKARHLCMEMRGVEKTGTDTTTAALCGVFQSPEPRAEFYSLIR